MRRHLRLCLDQVGPLQIAADGAGGDGGLVVVGQVLGDGLGSGVEPGGGEFLAQLDDQVDCLGAALSFR
jgi:hypothetical protein